MAVTFGFFNAIKSGSKYDRTYTAENFCDYLGSLVCNGIQKNYGNNLQVTKSSGLTVQVKSGKAWIDGHYLVNSDGLEIDLTGVIEPLSGYYGYAILCAYCDTTNRECSIRAVAGNVLAASESAAPELSYTLDEDAITYTDEDGVRYIPLAAAKIEYGMTEISSITDMRQYMRCILGACPNGLDSMQAAIEALQESLTALEESTGNLETDLQGGTSNLETQIASLESQIAELQENLTSQATEMQEEIESLSTRVETMESQSTLLSQAVGESSIAAVYANGCARIFGEGELSTPLNRAFIDCLAEAITASDGDMIITFDSRITSICTGFSNLLYAYFSVQSISHLPRLIIPGQVEFIGSQALCSPSVKFNGTMAKWKEIQTDGDSTITASIFSALLDDTTIRITCMNGILAWNSETSAWEEVSD